MSGLVSGRIAVGVDGSPASVAALRWAADEARLRDAEIVAVRAWHVGSDGLAPYAPVCRRPTREGERRRAEADLTAAMHAVFGPAPDVKVQAALVFGPPARVMVDQCAGADLLVLGGHHADSPYRPTVGAVAATCLRHARCPVLIVTAPASSPGPEAAPAAQVAPPAEVAPAELRPPAKPQLPAKHPRHRHSPGVRALRPICAPPPACTDEAVPRQTAATLRETH
jgi:nucleotide-binding universal stress UspA family protein